MFEDTIERTWKQRLFAAPTDRGEAVAICTDTGMAYVLLAAVAAGLGLILVALPSAHGPLVVVRARLGLLVVPIVLAALSVQVLFGLLIWKVQSRAAAVITLGLAVLSVAIHVLQLVAIGTFGLAGLFGKVVWVWVAVRAVQGTFGVHRFAAAAPGGVSSAKPAAI